MKTYDYYAVVYESDIWCVECLPDGIHSESESVNPIFAGSEWDYVPCCCVCRTEHDYVTILNGE